MLKFLEFPAKFQDKSSLYFYPSMKITDIILGKILMLREQKKTQTEMSRILSIPQHRISRVLKKYDTHGALAHLGGNGRPKLLPVSANFQISKDRKQEPFDSLRKRAIRLGNHFQKNISHMTIKRYLNDIDVEAFDPSEKPLLSPRHISLRWQAATGWLGLTDDEIKMIIFSDESKFNLKYSDGKAYVWREANTRLQKEHIKETVKFGGGSVMVWACFSYYGIGRLVFIEEKMDAPLYVSILSSSLPPSLCNMGLSDFIFQQDNDSKHTAKVTKEFFTNRRINVLPWPAQSPDMNPIENLWAHVKREVAKLQPKNLTELKEKILQAWSEITVETCQKYAMSFRKRSLALWRAHGKHTKY